MATKLEIYNMALSAARSQGNLASLTQETRGRLECDRWYNLVIDVTQEAAYWPCCKTRTTLEDGAEEIGHDFGYSHALPQDFLRPWYLADFGRFSLESKEDETQLFTDCEDTILYYAKRVTDTVRWPAAMTQAIVYGLAYKVCEPLSGKDTLVDRLLTLANGYLSSAQSVSVNYGSEARILDSDPDWIQARSSGIRTTARYYYPHGEVWTSAS